MFTVLASLNVKPDKVDEFLHAIDINSAATLRDEPGCLRFDVSSVDGDENRFVLYELYTDAEAFAAHKTTPHFARWRTVAEQVVVGQVNTSGSLLVTHTAQESV